MLILLSSNQKSYSLVYKNFFPHDSGAFARLRCDNSTVAPTRSTHVGHLARHGATPSTLSGPSLAANSSPTYTCESVFIWLILVSICYLSAPPLKWKRLQGAKTSLQPQTSCPSCACPLFPPPASQQLLQAWSSTAPARA